MANGVFTAAPNFGGGAFTGNALWLEIEVRPAGVGGYTLLSPRQRVTPAPYALALPGLWTRWDATSPSLIGGNSGNSVTAGVVGATVGGGGSSVKLNRVTDDFGTVGGGSNNQAGDGAGTTEDAHCSTVAGGSGNEASILSDLHCWVEFSQLDSGVGGGESPVDARMPFIS